MVADLGSYSNTCGSLQLNAMCVSACARERERMGGFIAVLMAVNSNRSMFVALT